jgi:FAD dependent oxidoreductase TIGR03364
MPNVWLTTGERLQADEVLICTGQDHAWLFPNDFQQSGLKLCKLQMFASNQYRQERIGTHLAGGLTLCHYEAFQACHSLVALKNHYQETHSDYLRHGIHVMVSQNESNELVLGDSHHYGDEIHFDQSETVDELILSYLNQMLPVERTSITRRWFGIYAKHPTQSLYTSEVQPGCHILSGVGGAGMTLSLGHAEAWWNTYAGA